jgi:SAM-dependent methyltransferase
VSEELPRTAKPETEDFFGKYESSGRIGRALVERYFAVVDALVARALRETHVTRALEVGCGPGFSTQRLSTIVQGVELEASEYVSALVETARTNNPGVKIEQEDIYHLRRADDTYGIVFLLEVLEHLDYPDRGLTEIKRVLKPGGLLILGVPREPIWRLLNIARGSYWRALGNTPGHLNHWSTRAIRRDIRRQIGDVIEIRKPLPWTLLLARVAK